jgi:mannose-6-phosphate isomerase-like protein (cupin superfamily)
LVPPAGNQGNEDAGDTKFTLEPAPGGTKLRVVEYPPDAVRFARGGDAGTTREMRGGADVATDTARHPGMHKTASLDYAIVLSGEIYAVLDQGETLMRTGDVLIQRGTSHAWSNRTDEPTRVAFVLVGAEPL